MTSLHKLGLKYGTDKATHHGYTHLYSRYFGESIGYGPGSLLELGWGGHEDADAGGASARMWRDWLPGWKIVVVDNEKKVLDPQKDRGIALLHADQTDVEAIAPFGPFDIIIDDASHISSLTIKSLQLLWPHLKPGGWYVVEDTHQAYHEHYYGQAEANADPDLGTERLGSQGSLPDGQTAMQFLKRLADEANFNPNHHPDDQWDLFPEKFWLGFDVASVHFHFNICFIQKRP